MGQGGSKPPIRMVLPEDERVLTMMVDGTGEDTQHATDTLGVAAEEDDYPDPIPPNPPQRHKRDVGTNDIGDTDDDDKNDGDTDQIQTHKLEDFIQVELVPVGASFKHYSKKKKHDNAFEDDNLSIIQNELTKSLTPLTTRTVKINMSTPNRDSTLNTSRQATSETEFDISKTTKRELMLTEREKYEYRKLHVTPEIRVPTRGQVRRWTFDMPLPRTAVGFRENYQNVEDRIAEELAERHKNHRAESYNELVKDLNMHLKSERLKVKVILAWINKQNIGRLTFGPKLPSPDTPNGYMMLIQENNGTFPVFFALLCRAARLKCQIISGISKGSKYETGTRNIEGLNNTWNAVFVDGSWQLVHPLWACKGIANRQQAGWMKIEEEGKSARSLSTANSGHDIHSFNPYFIFTKPEQFIVRNFPDDPKWQLLPNPLTIDEFMDQMYIRPIFFLNKFKLLSEDKCKFVSENGEPCEIKISFPKRKSHDVVFGYELSIKIDDHEQERGDPEKNPESVVMEDMDGEEPSNDIVDDADRYVMVNKAEAEVAFEVRFFKIGTYKLRLYGGYYSEFGSKPPWILDVLLECPSMVPKPQPLPFEPGTVGWGPGPISESLSLYVPSLTEGTFPIAEYEEALLYFVLQDKMLVRAELHHCKISAERLTHLVNTSIVEKENCLTVQIVVRYPGPGDYGLKILVSRHGEFINACNYMIQTRKKRQIESFYVRRAKQRVFEGMEKCDIDILTSAIEECDKHGVPNTDPEVMGGRNMLEFLSCKKELYVALLVNRIDVSEHALYRTRTANLDVLLGKECAKVEDHLEHMLKLDADGWTCEIPEIDRLSMVELSHMRKPKLEIRLVVVCVYMLLGVEEDSIQDWNKLRRYLRDQQSTLVEIARLEKYLALETSSNVVVDRSVIDRVEELLMNYTEEDIRRVDNTAAAYYKWVIGVTQKLKEKLPEETIQDERPVTLETVTPKSRSAKPSVNGSAVRSKKGFNPSLGPLDETKATIHRSGTKHNTKQSGADQISMSTSTLINGSNNNSRTSLKRKDSSRVVSVSAVSRKQTVTDIDNDNTREDTHGSLSINGVAARTSRAQSKMPSKVTGAPVKVKAPTMTSRETATTSVKPPSRMSKKDTPFPLKNEISGNTFFSERGSPTTSAKKKRP